MKTKARIAFRTLATVTLLALVNSSTLSAAAPPATSGHSFVNPNYKRLKLPNGEWAEETYTFGKGSIIDPTGADSSLNALTFQEIGQILAGPLLDENYVPTSSAAETDLVIVVSWGKTIPNEDTIGTLGLDGLSDVLNAMQSIQTGISIRDGSITPEQIINDEAEFGPTKAERSQMAAAENAMTPMLMMQSMSDRARRFANDHNARLLGYSPALSNAYQDALPAGVSKSRLEDLIAEIETPRYFVILQAYDFQKMWKEKKKELVWMTRFSIRARGRKFDEQLADMTAAASSLFGKEGGKLKRNLRPGRIKMGEVEVLGLTKEGEE